MERDLNRERRAKEDLEARLESVDKERSNLRREVEGLRDEVSDLRRRGDEAGSVAGGGGIFEGGGGGEDDGAGDVTDRTAVTGLRTVESEDRRRVRELEETVRMKNKQIHQLLEDIDQVEKEGVEYQNKVMNGDDSITDQAFYLPKERS